MNRYILFCGKDEDVVVEHVLASSPEDAVRVWCDAQMRAGYLVARDVYVTDIHARPLEWQRFGTSYTLTISGLPVAEGGSGEEPKSRFLVRADIPSGGDCEGWGTVAETHRDAAADFMQKHPLALHGPFVFVRRDGPIDTYPWRMYENVNGKPKRPRVWRNAEAKV